MKTNTSFSLFRAAVLPVALFITATLLCAGQTVNGGLYTFTSSTPVQVSSFAGTAQVNNLILKVPSGVCSKIYVGTNTATDPANGAFVIKAIFPSACNPPTDPNVGQIVDSWSISDFLQGDDGIDLADYWVVASDGVQVEWETVTVGITAPKTLHPVLSGLAYQGGPPNNAGVGESRVEVNVIPGADWKVSVCVSGTNWTNQCFYDMYPQYYQSNGELTTPTPAGWILQSTTLNGINTDFVLNMPGTNGSGTAFMSAWQYQ